MGTYAYRGLKFCPSGEAKADLSTVAFCEGGWHEVPKGVSEKNKLSGNIPPSGCAALPHGGELSVPCRSLIPRLGRGGT